MNNIKLSGLKNDLELALLYLRLNKINFRKGKLIQKNQFNYSINIVTKSGLKNIKDLLNARFGYFIKVTK